MLSAEEASIRKSFIKSIIINRLITEIQKDLDSKEIYADQIEDVIIEHVIQKQRENKSNHCQRDTIFYEEEIETGVEMSVVLFMDNGLYPYGYPTSSKLSKMQTMVKSKIKALGCTIYGSENT